MVVVLVTQVLFNSIKGQKLTVTVANVLDSSTIQTLSNSIAPLFTPSFVPNVIEPSCAPKHYGSIKSLHSIATAMNAIGFLSIQMLLNSIVPPFITSLVPTAIEHS